LTRKRSITDKVIDDICEGLKTGNFISTVCATVGISKYSYHNWKKKGKLELEKRENGERPDRGNDIYVKFYQETRKAERETETHFVRKIKALSDNSEHRSHFEAIRFFLQTRYRERYGNKSDEEIANQIISRLEIAVINGELDNEIFLKVCKILTDE